MKFKPLHLLLIFFNFPIRKTFKWQFLIKKKKRIKVLGVLFVVVVLFLVFFF